MFVATDELFGLKDKAMGYDLLLFDLRILRDEMCFDFDKSADASMGDRNWLTAFASTS